MTDTPRTDKAAWREHQQSVVDADFARQLERELAALKAEVSRISLRWEIADHRVSLLWAERDEAREMYCREAARHSVCRRSIMDARTIARMNGWDCFDAKEAKP
jgi:hypothetical protein